MSEDRIILKDGMAFRKAMRSEAKPLIGLYAESGCGKTLSALYLARGFVGPSGRIAMIETESGRGEAYVDMIPGGYDVCPIRQDFNPRRYGEAISLAEREGYDALIIDSASHEWDGVGGVCSMAADNEAAGKKGPLVWQKPKIDHQREFMLRLTGTPIPLVIVCMRAKYPMKQSPGKKDWERSNVLEPKQSDDILSEMFVHGWIDREHRFHGTKYTRDELRAALVDGEPITYESGRRLAQWASEREDGSGARLKACASLEALSQAWGALSKDDQRRFLVVKDARKAELMAKPCADLENPHVMDFRTASVHGPDSTPAQAQDTGPGPAVAAVSYAVLLDRMRTAVKSRERDVLDAHADLIQYLPIGQQPEANEVYIQCRAELEGYL